MTVEPVLTERPSDRKRDIVLLSDESDGLPDDKNLRLKGMNVEVNRCLQVLMVLLDLKYTTDNRKSHFAA